MKVYHIAAIAAFTLPAGTTTSVAAPHGASNPPVAPVAAGPIGTINGTVVLPIPPVVAPGPINGTVVNPGPVVGTVPGPINGTVVLPGPVNGTVVAPPTAPGGPSSRWPRDPHGERTGEDGDHGGARGRE
jgi:hypothetical protein